MADGESSSETKLPLGKWFDLEFDWDCAARTCNVVVDGRAATKLHQNRETLGACYIRLNSTAAKVDQAGLLLESIRSTADPAAK